MTKRTPQKTTKAKGKSIKPEWTVGTRVQKAFREGWFDGTIVDFRMEDALYEIAYDDGDGEHLDEAAMKRHVKILSVPHQTVKVETPQIKPSTTAGARKSRQKRKIQPPAVVTPPSKQSKRQSQCDEEWISMWELLKAYKEEKGNDYPKTNEIYQGKRLGHWVCYQRHRLLQKQQKESSTAWKIAKLDELHFVWDARPEAQERARARGDEGWLTWWQLLKSYKDEKGHVSPLSAEVFREQSIGRWVALQRSLMRQRKKGKLGAMKDWRIAKLNELEFSWGKSTENEAEAEAVMEERTPVDAGCYFDRGVIEC